MRSDIDLRALLGLLRRQARLIGTIVVLVSGLAALVVHLLPPLYAATALVLLEPGPRNLLREDGLDGVAVDDGRVDAEVELLRAEPVLRAVVAELALKDNDAFGLASGWTWGAAAAADGRAERALGRLRAALSVQRRGLTNLVAVTVRAPDPELAARIANTVAQIHGQQRLDARVTALLQAHDALQGRIEVARQALQSARADPTIAQATLVPLSLGTDATTTPPPAAFEREQAIRIAQASYDALLVRAEALATQAGLQLLDSQIVSPATPPVAPVFPSKGGTVVVAATGGLILGLVTAALFESLVGGITTPGQAETALRTSVLAVPRTGEAAPADQLLHAPLSPYAEAIRRLRALLHQAMPQSGAGGTVVLVASAQDGEGKSTTALSLARSAALAGERTLLIDCNLRRPFLHTLLGVQPSAGLLAFLRNDASQADLARTLVGDKETGLTAMVGLPQHGLVTEQLLAGPAFRALLQAARASFDTIVLDTPAVGTAVDPIYAVAEADAVVLVVRCAAVAQSEIKAAIAGLRAAMRPGAPLLGVLNACAPPPRPALRFARPRSLPA